MKLLKTVRQIIEAVGLGNVLIIAFVFWFLHTSAWVRLKVLLGIATDEEKKSVTADNEKAASEFFVASPSGDSVIDKSIANAKHNVAWSFYLNGCHKKKLISDWVYWGWCLCPTSLVSDKVRRRFKVMYENNMTEYEYRHNSVSAHASEKF